MPSNRYHSSSGRSRYGVDDQSLEEDLGEIESRLEGLSLRGSGRGRASSALVRYRESNRDNPRADHAGRDSSTTESRFGSSAYSRRADLDSSAEYSGRYRGKTEDFDDYTFGRRRAGSSAYNHRADPDSSEYRPRGESDYEMAEADVEDNTSSSQFQPRRNTTAFGSRRYTTGDETTPLSRRRSEAPGSRNRFAYPGANRHNQYLDSDDEQDQEADNYRGSTSRTSGSHFNSRYTPYPGANRRL